MNDSFVPNLILFARLLRDAGIATTPAQVSDCVRVLQMLGVERRDNVYFATRAIFVRRHADQATFDRAFELFFRIQGQPPQAVIPPTQAPRRAVRPKSIQQLAEKETRAASGKSPNENNSDAEQRLTYSALEILRRKNFAQFTDDEIRAARQLIASMQWNIGQRRTRRRIHTSRGRRIDFANLLRRNLKYGAEIFQLAKQTRRTKPRSLVVLADISGSMERYTRLGLHLLHALSHARFGKVEVFLFGTRLTRITPDLKLRNIDAALARVTQHVVDWSGGTRIGVALKEFNFKWARRVLRSSSVVLILSDGWDCGDLELLRDEMARLQKNCFRLIWLSPLTGEVDQNGLAQGLQVALAFVDDVLPVYDLASLERLVDQLESLNDARPMRRQRPHVELPTRKIESLKVMDPPQMGTSDYVRRTMVVRVVNGVPQFTQGENPG